MGRISITDREDFVDEETFEVLHKGGWHRAWIFKLPASGLVTLFGFIAPSLMMEGANWPKPEDAIAAFLARLVCAAIGVAFGGCILLS